MDNVCPFCGAGCNNIIEWADGKEYDWDCGSWKSPSRNHRSEDCYVRQIAQLTERLEAWRSVGYKVKNADVAIDVINKLKALGEI